MAEIAVVIIDPEEKRWAQLLDDQVRIRKLIPDIARNLDLPKNLNYELLLAEQGGALAVNRSLADVGVLPGAELLFRPVRDTILAKLLDKLYDEAKDYAKDQVWDAVKDRLKSILRLDPDFPDPEGFRKVFDDTIAAGRKVVDVAPLPSRAPPVKAGKQAQASAQRKATKAQAKSGVPTGCVIAGVVVAGGTFVIGGIIAVALIGIPLLREVFSSGNGFQDVVLGTGDVQVTLRWDSSADLDLHVIDPWGDEIYFSDKRSQSGGELDVDANAGCSTQSYSPVENIFWPSGGAPYGTYNVYVVDYNDCGENGYTSYEVVVKLDGRVYGTYRGEIHGMRNQQFIVSFDW